MPTINPSIPGRLTQLASGDVGSPRVSGDGQVVVWDQVVDGTSEIMRFEDGGISRVTADGHPSAFPSVSRDGSVISFTRFSSVDPRDASGNWDVYQSRGGQVSVVADGPSNQFLSEVSRDGNVIVFDDDTDGKWSNWNIGRWENGAVEKITNDRAGNTNPIVTGDGKQIYWCRYNHGVTDLWMRDQDGTKKAVLQNRHNHVTPNVTPDGKVLLWSDDSRGDDDLYQLRDGKIAVVAGERGVDETWAAMSADGKQVVWTNFDRRHGDAADTQVFLREGDVTQNLTEADGGLHSFPSMSDDGQKIAWLWVDPSGAKSSAVYLLERDKP